MPLTGDGRSGTFGALPGLYGGYKAGVTAAPAAFPVAGSRLVAQGGANPKFETLADTFDNDDQTKWVDASNVTVTGGGVSLTTSTTYQGRKSRLNYDLTNSYAVTPMTQTSGDLVAGGTVDTSFILELDANNYLSFTREGQSLFAQRLVGGVLSTVATIVGWSATTHRNVRYLHNGTTVAWQYSADGATWTTMGTPWAPTFPITGLKAYFETGMYAGNTTGSGTPALFESFNVLPAVATVSWQSETSDTALQLGWILNSGVSVRAVAATDSAFTTGVVYGNSITRPVGGWCTSRVTGLTANTLYYTGVEVDGTIIATGRGQYRTLRTSLAASKVITSSCYAAPGDQPVLARIKTRAPDFFVQQGDIHYWDAVTDAEWRQGFSDAVTSAGLSSMLATVPMPYVWNNHDWGGDASYADSPVAGFAPAAVRELSAGTVYPDTKGLWRTWVHAGVRYINIDPYAHRSPYTDPDTSAKTMLGATQKAWLLNLFATATEPAIIVFSGFAHPSSPAGTGRWGSYPDERTEIGNAIAALTATQRNKIVFVGGDTHSICADDGTNAMWGRPSLNASPMQGTGNGPQSGTWNITNQASDSARGYFSELNFTVSGSTLNMTWDALRDDGVSMATWSTSFPTGTAQGSGTGTFTFTGAGTGKRTPKGSGTGSSSFTGAGSGKRTPKASGSGSLTFTGSGSGISTHRGTGAGSWTVTGAGTGVTARRGTGSGSFAFVGSGTGKRVPKATGAGAWSFVGAGTGATVRRGTGSGTATWTGSGTGVAPLVGVNDGSGSGSWSFVGTGTGKRAPVGTGSGLATWTGTGAGVKPVVGGKSGTGAGTWTVVGTGSGRRQPKASGSGTWTYVGSGAGVTPPEPGAARDITLTIGPGRSRTLTATGASRGLTAVGRSRSLTIRPRE